MVALLIAGLIISPLVGVPPGIDGIPVWYQDTFYWGLACMGITGIITIILYWTGQLQPVRWNLIDLGVLILLIYMALRTSIMDFIPQSSWIQISYLGGMYGISRILWPSVNKKSLPLLLIIFLIAGIGQAGYGLGQLYGWWPSHHHLFPITGSFFNPGPYSGWLACVVPTAVYGIMSKNKSSGINWLYYLSWTYLFLATLVLFPAASRAALLAALVGVLVVSWPIIKNSYLWKNNWVKGSVATLFIVGLVGLYLMKKDSADGRLLIYKVTADMITEAPLIGWGWDGFPIMYNNFQALYFQNGYGSEREKYLADNVTYGFNELLEFTSEMGILGLLLVVLVVVLMIRKWRQQNKNLYIHPIHYLGLSVLVTWIVFALFSYPMSIPALAVISPITLSGINSSLSKRTTEHITFQNKCNLSIRHAGNIFIGLLILLITGYSKVWINHYTPLVRMWKLANANQDVQRYDITNSIYTNLYPEFRNEGLFLQFAGKSYSLGRRFFASQQMLERALFFSADPIIFTTLGKDYTLFSKVDTQKAERAEFLLSRAKYINPSKYYPRYLLANYYQRIGSIEKALEEAETLLAMQPKVVSPAIKDIRKEMNQLIEQNMFKNKKNIIPIISRKKR